MIKQDVYCPWVVRKVVEALPSIEGHNHAICECPSCETGRKEGKIE